MAEGWGPTAGNAAVTDVTTDYPWTKLHVGAPGAALTANPATETDRQEVTWGSASGGERANSNELEWLSVAGTEDFSHITTHTAETAGTPGISGTLTANPVTAGDTFTIGVGDLTVSVPLAS